MIGHYPQAEDFVVGTRFLTCSPDESRDFYTRDRKLVDFLMEVTSSQDGKIVATDQLGDTHEFEVKRGVMPIISRTARGRHRQVAWFGPLPDAPFEAMKALADVLLLQNRYQEGRPLLMLVGPEAKTARLVHPIAVGERPAPFFHGKEEDLKGDAHGAAFIIEKPVGLAFETTAELAEGDLVILHAYQMAPDYDAPVIVQAELAKLASGMDPASIGRWLPDPKPQPGRLHCENPLQLGTWHEMDHEISRAVARAEADEIVVLAVSVPGPPADIANTSLSSSGIKLFQVDALNDHLYGTDLEPGLWLGFDIKWYDAGDDGAEWAADWRPATAEDLDRHGLGLAEIADIWSEYAERDVAIEEVEALLASPTPA